MDKYTGKKLDGRYEIGELIGVGGMAYVYHCYDAVDNREVSIKILKDEYLHNADFIRRFKNESKAIAVLSHPNIVKIYDVSFGDVIQYIVMEYIDGITLKEYISQKGVIDWKETIYYITQVLNALQHAHENGIVHRDIKPQNIMLLEDGTIKVTDFGIARFADNATRTMTDQAIGSVHYIAPEQARGSVTDGKSDIYSVGVMMYEMLTGKLPFEADNAVSVAIMQLQSTAKKPRDINPAIPAGLEDITIKAMQKNPAMRYQSALEMLRDFETFKKNPSIRFNYNVFVDNEPTKYVGSVKNNSRSGDYKDNYSNNAAAVLDDKRFVDDKPKKKKTSTIAIAGVIAAVLVVAVVFGVISIINGFKTEEIKDVEVPEFIGQMLTDVQANTEYKFEYEIINKYDETQQIGIILDQDPAAGSKKVKENSKITLTVNTNETAIKILDVSGLSEEDAVSKINAQKLITEVLYVQNETVESGLVVETNPPALSEVSIGSTVYIYVSKGSENNDIEVPDVRGYSFSDAKQKITSLGLIVKYTHDQTSTAPADEVVNQNPLPGGSVEKGTVVELVLSAGQPIEKEVAIFVDLPAEESNTVSIRVLVDGVVNDEYSKDVVPMYNSTYTIKLKGTGEATIIVEINQSIYREYGVDFSTQSTTVKNTYPYTATTDPVVPDPTDEPTVDTTDPESE